MKTGITLALAGFAALGGSGILANIHVPFVPDGYSPPAQCTAWYDGCNMCQKNAEGVTICTARICSSPGHGFCEAYASSTPQTT